MERRTYSPKPNEVDRDWYIVDAEGKTLGRLATIVATMLRGKHKPQYAPHVDTGDFVIVINAEKVLVTGNKEHSITYNRHSNYPGGFRSIPLAEMRRTHPDRIISEAVRGMLPKGPHGLAQHRKLRVYGGSEHPHEAQNPTVIADSLFEKAGALRHAER
ncbi:MAG TPA: 50S ribosomal protein L13 [Thermomicrobiales bacterium]|jgi:large subunit ribosomal protein L13|nr:50S ribosomal protein L13 [Thermomicrobiales bacterium]